MNTKKPLTRRGGRAQDMPELIMVSGTIVTVVFTIERVISGITKSKLFLLPAPAGIFICTQHR